MSKLNYNEKGCHSAMMIETRDSLLIDTKTFEIESLRSELHNMRQQRDDWESAWYELRRAYDLLREKYDKLTTISSG